jgi:excisionase family DNA binding protein
MAAKSHPSDSPLHVEMQMAKLAFPDDFQGPGRRLMRLIPACEYAQVGRTKMYELIKSGEVTVVKAGRSTLVDLDSVDRFFFTRERSVLALRETAIKKRAAARRMRKR